MKTGSQVDVGLERAIVAAECLRRRCKSREATANLAVVRGLLESYSPNEIGGLWLSSAPHGKEIAERFEEFIQDETYRQLSEASFLLGIPARAKRAIDLTHRLAKRVVRKQHFSKFFRYGSRMLAMSEGVPAPSADILEIMLDEAYLPPVADVSQSVEAARRAYSRESTTGLLGISSELLRRDSAFSPLRLVYEAGVLEAEYDMTEFLAMYKASFALREDERTRSALNRLFFENTQAPFRCPEHGEQIAASDMGVCWNRGSVSFRVAGCCEENSQRALVEMLRGPDQE